MDSQEKNEVAKIDNVFTVAEKMDDEQIIADITNGIFSDSAKNLYYPLTQNGKTIDILSKKGIDECCIAMQKEGYIVREEEITYELCPVEENFVIFKAFVSSYVQKQGEQSKLNSVIGTKRQGLIVKTKYGDKKDDFWFEKGSQKAIRNAKWKLIPERIKADLIFAAKKQEHSFRSSEKKDILLTRVNLKGMDNFTWRDLVNNAMTPSGAGHLYLAKLSMWEDFPQSQKKLLDTSLSYIKKEDLRVLKEMIQKEIDSKKIEEKPEKKIESKQEETKEAKEEEIFGEPTI